MSFIRKESDIHQENGFIVPLEAVDNSIEISNISLTPKDLIDTHHIMTLIMKE